MFAVSEKFRNAVKQNARRYEWTGTVTTKSGKVYPFGAKEIVKGSGYIKWQCCSGTEIELGTVYAAEMGISLFLDADRYTMQDAVVRIYYTLELLDGTKETIPMGIYEVSEANRKVKTLELKGYDYMLRFDKTLKIESSSGTPYQFLKVCCDACKVQMAQTVAEINAMPNGKVILGIYQDNDIETFRDLIYYVAQVLGGYCQIDRYGRLVIKHYNNSPVWTVEQKQRFDSSYSDFVTRYTAVSSTNQINQTSEYIAMETDDALTMNLGINPLLQFGLKSTRERMLREVLVALQKVQYVPFDSTTIGNPALEPGDVLRFTGGHADDSKISCITDIEYKIGGRMSLKCVGKNPRMASAKSKNEKNITGLLNSVENGKTIIYSFVNVAPFEIGVHLTNVMDIDFTATEDTSAAFQCEMLLEVLKPETPEDGEGEETSVLELPTLSIIYKMNNETIDGFMPTKTCVYGKHIVTLFFPLSKVVENSSNIFSMYLKMEGATATIGEAQIRATISGQGLAAGLGDWNGRININENIGFVPISDVPFVVDAFKDKASIIFPVKKVQGLTQTIGDIPITQGRFRVDTFTDRTWIAEIVRTFVLTSVRGKPQYNGFITINTDEMFILRKNYQLTSEPLSVDMGFLEAVITDTGFLESVSDVEYRRNNAKERMKFMLTAAGLTVIPDGIETKNKYFELKEFTQTGVSEKEENVDYGYLQCLSVDTSAFDGVRGVEFKLWTTIQ